MVEGGVQDIRWKQRLANFNKAMALLAEPVGQDLQKLSLLEQQGVVQRFEFSLELAWKTLKDFMESQGAELVPATPKNVVKQAFAMQVVPDGQVWIDMLDHRNRLSHLYEEAEFRKVMEAISSRYFPALEQARNWLAVQAAET